MILGTGCLGDASLDGVAIRDALAAVHLDEVLLVVGPDTHPRALAGLSAPAVRASWHDAVDGVSVAAAAKSRRLAVTPPDDLSLEEVCRGLFRLARSAPGLALALVTPPAGPLASPDQVRHVCEDLESLAVGYWHRPSVAHVVSGAAPPERWVDELSRWVVGVSLDDVRDGEVGIPPGLGELDLPRLAALSARAIPVALDVDPVPDVGLLKMTVDTLTRAGFA